MPPYSMTERNHPTRTSVSDPIRVDFLPIAIEGRIGLTFAPGKRALSLSGIRWNRDLSADLDRLVSEYHADILVCLVEDHELRRLGIPDLAPQALSRNIDLLRLPIPDGGVLPNPMDVQDVIERILLDARAGKTVVVHCAGGLGRTGTIAGCVLVALGYNAKEAIKVLHDVRGPRCPENRRQEAFIEAFSYLAGPGLEEDQRGDT